MIRETEIKRAVLETGLPEETISDAIQCLQKKDYSRAKEILHNGRQNVLGEIYEKEDTIRHIDWIIYQLADSEEMRK